MTYKTSELIHFDAAGRHSRYVHANGIPVPGVTSILEVISKPALITWAAGCASDYWLTALDGKTGVTRNEAEQIHKAAKSAHRTISKSAADVGTEVHKYAEAALKGLSRPQLKTPEATNAAQAFNTWIDAHNIEPIHAERIVFSQANWYAGTCDFVGRIDGRLSVLDFKTSSGIWPEFRLQLSAYRNAYEEETGEQIEQCMIVRFDKKTGAFEVAKMFDHERDLKGFLHALSLSRILKQIEESLK